MTDPALEALTGPGGPFEFVEARIRGMPCNVFKHTPQCLSDIYQEIEPFMERELAVYEGRRLSYRDARQQAAELAQLLAEDHAITKGSRIGLAMHNSPEWMVSFMAITSLGAVAVLINSKGSADEMAYCLNHSRCTLLMTDTRTQKRLEDTTSSAVPLVFDLERSFHLEPNGQELLRSDVDLALPVTPCDPDETALIMFTSGTTGRPKGACLTHRGVLTALKTIQFSSAIIGMQMAAKYGIDLQTLAASRPQPCTLLMFPLFHVSGCYSVFLANLLQGGKIVMMSRWRVDEAMQLIQDEKVSTFPGVPTMYWDLVNCETRGTYDLSSLASLSVAGQATPLSLLHSIREVFPAAIVGCGYGMTETNGPVSMIIGEDLLAAPNSVGRPVATSEIRLLGEDGEWVEWDATGEICVRGAIVMEGYDDDEAANRSSFHEGWFRTGDIGRFDEEGRLHIVDRSTEMVISGGENIYCAEVERVLAQAPDVIEVATLGVPDDRLGEKMIAFIRTRGGSDQDVEGIIQFAAERLAAYKLPAQTHLVDTPMPRNATGKILKKNILAWHQARKPE